MDSVWRHLLLLGSIPARPFLRTEAPH